MSGAFFLEIVEGGSHHAGKSLYIGTCRVQFDVRLSVPVLMSHAGTEEKQVHASQLFYQVMEV